MKPSIALVFVVTFVVAVTFILLGLATVIASVRWALIDASASELLRAAGLWAVSFVVMQAWSYYLRHASAD